MVSTSIASVLAILFMASGALGQTATLRGTAAVTATSGTGGIQIGDQVEFSFSLDGGAPDSNPTRPNDGFYPSAVLGGQIAIQTQFEAVAIDCFGGRVFVANDVLANPLLPGDYWGIDTASCGSGLTFIDDVDLVLRDADATAWSSDALLPPGFPVPLASLEQKVLQAEECPRAVCGQDPVLFLAEITSVELVAEPSVSISGLGAVGALAALKWLRSPLKHLGKGPWRIFNASRLF